MFFKHRFFLSTIAFFCTTAYSSPHDCLSLFSWIHFSSPHDCLSLSTRLPIPLRMDSFPLSVWIHFSSPHGFISPLRMDSFPLSARLPTPLHTEHPLFFWYIQQTRKRKIHLHSHNCYCEYFTSQ